MDQALIKPKQVRCSVKIASPWVWDDEAYDYVEKSADVTAVGTLVEVKDPRQLRAREFRADMVHGPDSTNEDIIMTDLAPALEAVLNGTDAVLLLAGMQDGGQVELMDGAEGLAAAAVWQLAKELQDRQASHRANGAVGYSYHMRMQCFQLTGDSILDLLTDSPDVARLVDSQQGVIADGVRTASAASPEEFMKYVEGAQRRLDPATRQVGSIFYIIEVTQADYYEGWGLYGKLHLVESATMDCLAEDKGLVAVREGFDRYRGVYHMRTLAKSWKSGEPSDANASSFTWLLRDMFTGASVEGHILFCVTHEKPFVSIALLELMEACMKIETNPVTQDHRVAGWVHAMRAERIQLKQAAEKVAPSVDKETRGLVLELEKRLAAAERAKDDAQKTADARQDRAHTFQDKYVNALENQESMQERLIGSEEEYLKAMQHSVEAQLETSEVKDQFSEMQYTDNVLLMMLEQEVLDMKASTEQAEEAAEKEAADMLERQAKKLEEAEAVAEDLRFRHDGLAEAKIQAEVQREVEKGNLENKIEALRLEMKEAGLDQSRLHQEERGKIEETLKEELERVKQAAEDDRSKARQALEDGGGKALRDLEEERLRSREVLEEERGKLQEALEASQQYAQQEVQQARAIRREETELRDNFTVEEAAANRAHDQGRATAEELQEARQDFSEQLVQLAAAEGGDASAAQALKEQVTQSWQREQGLQQKVEEQQTTLDERKRQLKQACRAALDWAPESVSEAEKENFLKVLESTEEEKTREGPNPMQELSKQVVDLQNQLDRERQEAAATKAQHALELRGRDKARADDLGERSADKATLEELQTKLGDLQSRLESEKSEAAELKAQHAQKLKTHDEELRSRDVEKAKLQADLLAARREAPPAAGLPATPGGGGDRLSQIQSRLLSEVESLRNGAGSGAASPAARDQSTANLLEQNRGLQARVALLEQSSPAEKRAQVQRLTFLERSVKDLEAERSELVVRTTVAEEQLRQMQKHLKAMTEDYQMQIVNLKLKLKE